MEDHLLPGLNELNASGVGCDCNNEVFLLVVDWIFFLMIHSSGLVFVFSYTCLVSNKVTQCFINSLYQTIISVFKSKYYKSVQN